MGRFHLVFFFFYISDKVTFSRAPFSSNCDSPYESIRSNSMFVQKRGRQICSHDDWELLIFCHRRHRRRRSRRLRYFSLGLSRIIARFEFWNRFENINFLPGNKDGQTMPLFFFFVLLLRETRRNSLMIATKQIWDFSRWIRYRNRKSHGFFLLHVQSYAWVINGKVIIKKEKKIRSCHDFCGRRRFHR